MTDIQRKRFSVALFGIIFKYQIFNIPFPEVQSDNTYQLVM